MCKHGVGFSLDALCEVGVQVDYVRVMLGEFDGVWIGVHIEIQPLYKVRVMASVVLVWIGSVKDVVFKP
jgi:hypothetical protein